MRKLDRYIFFRLLTITLFVLIVLVCIFILIDFSENSDEFADKGASLEQIWKNYYLNYIPEMTRLVVPVAFFVACLFLTGQMSERLEITAIKAAGISLYRLALPYLLVGALLAGTISYLDANIIPKSNADRIAFEQEYLSSRADRIDRGGLYRQESPNTIFHVNHYDHRSYTGYNLRIVEFGENNDISKVTTAHRIVWIDSLEAWEARSFRERKFQEGAFTDSTNNEIILELNILPRDLARRTSDIYQLTYREARQYIESIRRIGAGEVNLPLVQFYGRVFYPVSILVVCLIGFALAAERRKGGKGFYIAAGIAISFIYLVLKEIFEPFGATGALDPLHAAILPHLFFLLIGIGMLLYVKK